jgi:putative hemolysin
VLGVVHARTILTADPPVDLSALLEPPVFVPGTMDAFRVLETFKRSDTQLMIVIDEYGGTQGIVTPGDILEAIVGSMPSSGSEGSPPIARLGDGSWSVDGTLSVQELKDALGLHGPEAEVRADYRSLGGLMMSQLDRIPSVGDRIAWAGLRLEILDMDGRRVDRILVRPLDADEEPEQRARTIE